MCCMLLQEIPVISNKRTRGLESGQPLSPLRNPPNRRARTAQVRMMSRHGVRTADSQAGPLSSHQVEEGKGDSVGNVKVDKRDEVRRSLRRSTQVEVDGPLTPFLRLLLL